MDDNNFSDFWQGLKTLESYGLISFIENKNKKQSKVALKADIDEIRKGINESKIFWSLERKDTLLQNSINYS